MTADMLPGALRGYIADVAARQGVPIEFPATACIVAAGSVLGRRLTIRPKGLDNWTVVPNLWGALVADPSELKSPSINSGIMPLRRLSIDADEAYARDHAMHTARLEVLMAQKVAAARRANKGGDEDTAVHDVASLQARIDTEKIESARRRYIVNDATVEALIVILAENSSGVLEFRDELSGFLAGLSREGREGERPFYLEAWDGGTNGVFEQDRIGRDNVRVKGPCLSMFGGIQPARMEHLIRGTLHGGPESDGFLPRFQLVVWPDDGATVEGIDRAPDVAAEVRAVNAFRVLNMAPDKFAAETEDGALPFLRFAPDAQPIFTKWYST